MKRALTADDLEAAVYGGWIGVARNPVSIGYAREHGAVGAISRSIDLGRAFLDGGLPAVTESLGGTIAAEGTVVEFVCEQREGLDVGRVTLDDARGTTLHFVNEYILAEQGEERLEAFPALIMTFDVDGTPVPSGHVVKGQQIQVLTAPASSMVLAPTMFMPALFRPLEQLLGIDFAPTAR